MWRDIKDYEGLYEINENAVVRRVEGKGIDGRKVTTECQRYFAQEPVGSGKRTVDWREQTR